jgi:hypothetical protein
LGVRANCIASREETFAARELSSGRREHVFLSLSLFARGEKMSTFVQFHFPKNLKTSLPDAGCETS